MGAKNNFLLYLHNCKQYKVYDSYIITQAGFLDGAIFRALV